MVAGSLSHEKKLGVAPVEPRPIAWLSQDRDRRVCAVGRAKCAFLNGQNRHRPYWRRINLWQLTQLCVICV